MELKPQHKMFADKYLELGSVEKAALEAGYSKTYARARAHTLLANIGVKQYMAQKMEEISKPTIASAEEVLQYFTRVMRGEEKDAFGLDASIVDRNKAAESLGKRHGLFTEKIEITKPPQIVDDISD